MSDWCIHKNSTKMLPCITSPFRPPAGGRWALRAQEALYALVLSVHGFVRVPGGSTETSAHCPESSDVGAWKGRKAVWVVVTRGKGF